MPKAPKRKAAETIKFGIEVPDAERTERRWGSLVVVQGAEADLGTHVVCDRPIVMGRDPEVELPLRDGSASRRHCQVERDGNLGTYLLRDLGSTNGTHVNGKRVDGSVLLAEGDKIFLGSSVVKFTFTDELDVEYMAKLNGMVSTDALTGLLARRKFDAAFAAAADTARADGSPLACLVMDMDGLKRINDTHGHEMGGYCIITVAQVMREVLGPHGEICRYGGDEFVSFLPGSDKSAGQRLAEAVRDAVAHRAFVKDGITVAPTLSIGVSALGDDGDAPTQLFTAADRALYKAKAAGKNQVVLAEPA
jgi:two-component system, cell cycle response regulator